MPRNVIIYAGSKPVIWGDAAIAAPPPPAAVPQLSLIAGAVSSTVGVAATGWSVSNTGTLPALATVTVPGDVTSTFTNGQTVAAGANVAFALTALVSGAKSIALTSATPGAVITGSPATLTGVSAPPPPPPPSGTTITSLTVQSTSAATLPYSATVLPLRGTVPAGSTLRSTDDANLRASVLSTHDDGSAAVVVVAGSKAFASGASTISVQTSAASDTPLTAAAISALVSSVSVAFDGGYGTATRTDFSTPDRIDYANGQVIAARYRVAAPTPGSTTLEAVIYIRAFASGRAKVRVVIENATVTIPTPTAPASASYSAAVVAVNGSTIATINGNGAPEGAHAGFRAVMAETWIGGDPGLRVTQLHTDLQKHPLLWQADATNTADLSSYASDAYTPWTTGRQRATGMGAGGDHASIGPLTQWQSRALQTGDHRAWKATEVSDLAVLGFAINHRHATTGDVPTIAEVATYSINAGINVWPTIGNSQNGAMGWEVAHHPAVGLMGFLSDPCPVFIELAQKVALWNALYSVFVGDGSRVTTGVFGPPYETRGRAWGMRSLSHATLITPASNTAWKAAAVASLGANFAYLDQYRASSFGTLNFGWGGSPGSPAIYTSQYNVKPAGAGFGAGLWQYCFLILALHRAASARLLTGSAQTTADAIADWCATWPARYVNEQPNGGWRFIHSGVTLGSTPGTLASGGFTTWTAARAYAFTDTPASVSGVWRFTNAVDHPATYADAAFIEAPTTDGVSYPAQFYSALMAGVERGVSGAAVAYAAVQAGITNITAWRAGMGADGRYNVAPRSGIVFASGADAGTFDAGTDTWSPARTAGVVNQSSWDIVPTGRWVKVSGSRLDSLTAATIAASTGWTESALAWPGVMEAWNGFAIDPAGSRVWLVAAGGHADSGNNGVYRFDASTMSWAIERAPSNRNEWSAQYRNLTAPQPGTYTSNYESSVATPQQELGEVGTVGNHFFDVLFWDKRPTSRHVYSTPVYVPQSNELVMLCRQFWKFDLASKDWTYRRRAPSNIDGAGVYGIHDEATNTYLFGGASDGVYASHGYNLASNEWTTWGVGGAPGGSPWALYVVADTRHDRIVTAFSPPVSDNGTYVGRYWRYSLDTRALTQVASNIQFGGGLTLANFPSQYAYYDGCGMVYVPPLNRYWINTRMSTGLMGWLELDPTTTPWTLRPLTLANDGPSGAQFPLRKTVWLPQLNALLAFRTANQPGWVYKF